MAELANSLMLEGQRQAAKGYLHEDGIHFVITCGQRRYRAMLYANENHQFGFETIIADIEPKIAGKNPTGKQLIYRQFADDNHEEICALDKATAIKELIDSGESVADIASGIGYSDQQVRNLLKLLEAPEDIQQAVRNGAISATAATKTARARKEAQEEIRDKIETGEHVSIKDVDIASGKPKMLTFEEAQKQIKKADALKFSAKTDRERRDYEFMIIGMRKISGLDEPLK